MRTSTIERLALAATVALAATPAAADPIPCTGSSYRQCTLSGTCGANGALPDGATLELRFAQLSDVHIYDDDAAALLTGSALETALEPSIGNGSAQRLQDEYTDEVLNAMIGTVNACNTTESPIELMIATGDNTDNMTLNEIRRYVDNLDGVRAGDTAYESFCGYLTHDSNGDPKLGAPPCTADLKPIFAIPTGKLAADSQSNAPDPETPGPNGTLNAFVPTRSATQVADSAASSIVGVDHSYSIAPGLPPALRCDAGSSCGNLALEIPYYAVFGNHDGANRGTVTFQQAFQAAALAHGRYFFESQREWINEFFATGGTPLGHGFGFAGTRLADADDRNDGYYSFLSASGVRIIVLNTLYDGVRSKLGPGPSIDLHQNGATGAATGGHVRGNEATNPIGLETGVISTEQFDWLETELAAAAGADQPTLVFSHHPDRSFSERRLGFPADGGKTAVELDRLLGKAQHGGNASTLVAWIAGHTHENVVSRCSPGAAADCLVNSSGSQPNDGTPDSEPTIPDTIERGFWRVETASLIDYPQEARIVELYSVPDGHALKLTTIRPDPNDGTAQLSYRLSRAEAACNLSQILGGSASTGPYDAGRLATVQAGLTAAAGGDFCQGEDALLITDGKAAGGVDDRDVILLP